MSPSRRTLFIPAAAIAASAFAIHSCGNLAEAFYALIPPFALAYLLIGVMDWHDAFHRRLRPGLAIVGALLTISISAGLLVFGPRVAFSWRFWLEAATCLYYLSAILILLLAIRRSLLSFAKSLQERWEFSPGVRLLVCEALPLALFVLFALPLGIAFAQVHRFKMPNFADPRSFWGREYEAIEFASGDTTQIRGWWIPANKPSARTLVICHGIAANRSIFLPFVEVGDWLDANVLMFDLRGHGDSGGRTVTLGYREKDDILAAVAWARRERPDEAREVIGLGISLGAAALAEAAPRAEPPVDLVILDSCFASTRDMTHSVLGAFPAPTHPWLLTLGLPMADWHAGCAMMDVCPERSIEQLRSPVLLFHSRGDSLIPSDHGRRVYEKAPGHKRLVVFDIDGHANAFFVERERYREEVISFSARKAPGKR